MSYPLVLASGSLSRKTLLNQAGLSFQAVTSHFDESEITTTDPTKLVGELSEIKAKTVALSQEMGFILAADTVIVFDRHILGKPKFKMEALATLKKLSNKTHEVVTGWTLIKKRTRIIKTWTGVSTTKVTFRRLSAPELEAYVNDHEVTQWAAGYNPYSRAVGFISAIEGSYGGLHGLPLEQIIPLLDL